MFIVRAKPIRIIGVPDNHCPDEWNSVVCTYLNRRTGEQDRQSDDGQTHRVVRGRWTVKTAPGHNTVVTLYRHQDRQTHRQAQSDLHYTCGHRSQQGHDSSTLPAVRTALKKLNSKRPVQLQALRCLCTFTVGQQLEYCSG